MRTLAKILVAVGLALTVSTAASATISIQLVQVGGTYDGVLANAGDTLVLDIRVDLDGGGPETGLTAAGVELAFGGSTFNSGTEQPFAFVNGGLLQPIGTAGTDIGLLGPGLVKGWEATTLAVAGVNATLPANFSIGTATFTLDGNADVIAAGGATTIGIENFVDATGVSNLGSFAIIGVPEPTTASLLGLGLLGLSVAGRNRKN